LNDHGEHLSAKLQGAFEARRSAAPNSWQLVAADDLLGASGWFGQRHDSAYHVSHDVRMLVAIRP
jgi:hypothetical protein